MPTKSTTSSKSKSKDDKKAKTESKKTSKSTQEEKVDQSESVKTKKTVKNEDTTTSQSKTDQKNVESNTKGKSQPTSASSDAKAKDDKKATGGQAEEVKSTSQKSSSSGFSMEDLLNQMDYELKAPKKGDVVTGVVTEINRRMVLVDIGGKTEGMVVDQEFEATKDLIGDLQVGDKVEVYVSAAENDRGQILLSLKKAAVDRKWEYFTELMETGKRVNVTGLEVNRGGMIVMAEGLRGFVPSSQFGTSFLGNMDRLLDQEFEVKVIEVDKPKNRLIFSEREVSEAEAIKMKSQALDVVKVGEIYEGVVSGIMPFGAFVTVSVPLEDAEEELGQIEGLVHISEISWEKVNDPNDYFTQGDRVKVKVLGIDENKLNLSVKQLTNDPWSEILKKYEVGTTITGKVTRVEPFGVFVTLEPGVDGLIHISKIQAGTEPEAGNEINVVVDSVDIDNRRMSLGMVLTEVPLMYK